MQPREIIPGESSQSTRTIELLEEQIEVAKVTELSGRVRVSSVTETVEETVKATLEGQEVEVVRVPVDRMVDEVPPTRVEGDVTIIPIMEEILVVEKRLRLKEELHIRTIRTEEAVNIPVDVRKQRAVIERLSPETGRSPDEEHDHGL